MVPVSLHSSDSVDPDGGGNAVGAVMCRLGTDLDDAGERLQTVHRSMEDGKAAMRTMTPNQILAMSALGLSPLALWPALRLTEHVRPPFNLIISNVPGPRQPLYWNGARLDGLYPLSIPLDGQALNITCTTYDREIAFGLTGCRRTRAAPAADADLPRPGTRRARAGRRRRLSRRVRRGVAERRPPTRRAPAAGARR